MSLGFLRLKTDSLVWGSIIVTREGKLTEEYVERNFMSHFCLLLLVRIKSCDRTKVAEIRKWLLSPERSIGWILATSLSISVSYYSLSGIIFICIFRVHHFTEFYYFPLSILPPHLHNASTPILFRGPFWEPIMPTLILHQVYIKKWKGILSIW